MYGVYLYSKFILIRTFYELYIGLGIISESLIMSSIIIIIKSVSGFVTS